MKFRLNNIITEIEIIEKFEDLKSINTVAIIDQNIYKIYMHKLEHYIKDFPIYIFDAKENNKTIDEVKKILSFFIKNNVSRETIILGIGGGITTDIAAFAASTFKRGCKLQLIPTTFLAMIDAAIGGKTAINFNGIKNVIGTFYPAEKVYIHPDFLETLSKKDYSSGWAECVKVALVDNTDLLKQLTGRRQKIDENILTKAIRIKMEICNQDFFDNGKRQLLNLGHSVGHIIEVISNFSIPHGISVAIGIRVIAGISFTKDLISKTKYIEIIDLLKLYELDVKQQYDVDYSSILSILKQDKKNRGLMNLILFNESSVFIKEMVLEKAVSLIDEHIHE